MSAVLSSSGHQKLLREARAPTSGEMKDWVAWAFEWTPAQAEQHLKAVEQQLVEIDPHDRHVVRDLGMPLVIETCRLLGLPCNPEQHEQPHQIAKLFPHPRASSSLYELMTDPHDDERPMEPLVPSFQYLWGIKLREIATKNVHDLAGTDGALTATLYDLHPIAYRLLLLFWPDRYTLKAGLYELDCYTRYLSFTRGCFDMESGDLVDLETPALREFSARGPR